MFGKLKNTLRIIIYFLVLNGISQENKNYEMKVSFEKSYNKYQYDFEYLTVLCDSTFPKINDKFPKSNRDELKLKITERLGKSDVNDLIFNIQTNIYLAKFENEHTNIQIAGDVSQVFPFSLLDYNKEFYLQNIDKTVDSSYIGKKVMALNDIPIQDVFDRLKLISNAENNICKIKNILQQRKYIYPESYTELGIFDTNDSLKISFEDNKSIIIPKIPIKTVRFYKIKAIDNQYTKKDFQNRPYTFTFQNDVAYLQFNACMDKQAMLDGIDDYVKPLFRGAARVILNKQYKIDIDKQDDRAKGYINKEYPFFKDFLLDFFSKLKENKASKLIIDMRNNRGGEERLGLQLLYYLTKNEDLKSFKTYIYTTDVFKYYFERDYKKFENKYKAINNNQIPPRNSLILQNKKLFEDITNPDSAYYIAPNRPVFEGKIVLLANHNTGSAAALTTSLFQDNNLGTVIGTSVSNNPTGATQLTSFELPKTKSIISIASMYLIRPDETRGDIQKADIWIEKSFSEVLNGVDKLYERALEQ